MKDIKKTNTIQHRLYFFPPQTQMPCELNPRAPYPRLARIVFDLASIRGGRKSCEREETVCVSGGRKTQGKTRGTSLSVCCSLFLFFLVHKHSSKPGIAVESIEKHVHQSLMCHPRASWNHTHKTPWSPLRFVKLYKEEGCVAVGKNEEKEWKWLEMRGEEIANKCMSSAERCAWESWKTRHPLLCPVACHARLKDG